MARTLVETIFEDLLKAISEGVKPLGFARRGLVFRLMTQENCGILEFQRSTKDSKDALLFTINLGVIYGKLLDCGSSGIARARIVDAHLRQRIGMLLPGRVDKWWEISEMTDWRSLSAELLEVVLDKAVPYIKDYLNADTLLALWEQGQSPGLTDVQRARFLLRLEKLQSGAKPDSAD